MFHPLPTLPGGTRLHDDQYEVRRCLGRGGFGVTYLAAQFGFDRAADGTPGVLQEVAIKEFFPRGYALREYDSQVVPAHEGEAHERFVKAMHAFKREAQAIATLRHPNIVSILSVFESFGTAYFVMPYLRGRSLHRWISEHGTLTVEQIHTVVLPVLDGLEEVHDFRLIHRDLKPDNIMIHETGRSRTLRPVLIDFGAARGAVEEDGEAAARASELVTHTVGFTPPEQYDPATCHNRQGPFTDLYAFCAMLYQCVTGQVPPMSLTRAVALSSSGHDSMTPAAALVTRAYPPELLACIAWGMELDPARRPQTVADLRDALLGRLPVPGGRPRTPAPTVAAAPPPPTAARETPAPGTELLPPTTILAPRTAGGAAGPVSVSRGGNLNLTRAAPGVTVLALECVAAFAGQSASGEEIDACAFLLGADGKVRSDTDFVFYNNPRPVDGAVRHLRAPGADSGAAPEGLAVDLAALPATVARVAFAASMAVAGRSFGELAQAVLTVRDAHAGVPLLRYDFTEDGGAETALIVAELYRFGGDWKLKAVGQGFVGGLERLARYFGVNVAS